MTSRFHGLSELLFKSPRSPTAALAPDWETAISGQTPCGWLDATNERTSALFALLLKNLVRWKETYRSALQRWYHTSVADVVAAVAVAVAAAAAARTQEGFVP